MRLGIAEEPLPHFQRVVAPVFFFLRTLKARSGILDVLSREDSCPELASLERLDMEFKTTLCSSEIPLGEENFPGILTREFFSSSCDCADREEAKLVFL